MNRLETTVALALVVLDTVSLVFGMILPYLMLLKHKESRQDMSKLGEIVTDRSADGVNENGGSKNFHQPNMTR